MNLKLPSGRYNRLLSGVGIVNRLSHNWICSGYSGAVSFDNPTSSCEIYIPDEQTPCNSLKNALNLLGPPCYDLSLVEKNHRIFDILKRCVFNASSIDASILETAIDSILYNSIKGIQKSQLQTIEGIARERAEFRDCPIRLACCQRDFKSAISLYKKLISEGITCSQQTMLDLVSLSVYSSEYTLFDHLRQELGSCRNLSEILQIRECIALGEAGKFDECIDCVKQMHTTSELCAYRLKLILYYTFANKKDPKILDHFIKTYIPRDCTFEMSRSTSILCAHLASNGFLAEALRLLKWINLNSDSTSGSGSFLLPSIVNNSEISAILNACETLQASKILEFSKMRALSYAVLSGSTKAASLTEHVLRIISDDPDCEVSKFSIHLATLSSNTSAKKLHTFCDSFEQLPLHYSLSRIFRTSIRKSDHLVRELDAAAFYKYPKIQAFLTSLLIERKLWTRAVQHTNKYLLNGQGCSLVLDAIFYSFLSENKEDQCGFSPKHAAFLVKRCKDSLETGDVVGDLHKRLQPELINMEYRRKFMKLLDCLRQERAWIESTNVDITQLRLMPGKDDASETEALKFLTRNGINPVSQVTSSFINMEYMEIEFEHLHRSFSKEIDGFLRADSSITANERAALLYKKAFFDALSDNFYGLKQLIERGRIIHWHQLRPLMTLLVAKRPDLAWKVLQLSGRKMTLQVLQLHLENCCANKSSLRNIYQLIDPSHKLWQRLVAVVIARAAQLEQFGLIREWAEKERAETGNPSLLKQYVDHMAVYDPDWSLREIERCKKEFRVYLSSDELMFQCLKQGNRRMVERLAAQIDPSNMILLFLRAGKYQEAMANACEIDNLGWNRRTIVDLVNKHHLSPEALVTLVKIVFEKRASRWSFSLSDDQMARTDDTVLWIMDALWRSFQSNDVTKQQMCEFLSLMSDSGLVFGHDTLVYLRMLCRIFDMDETSMKASRNSTTSLLARESLETAIMKRDLHSIIEVLDTSMQQDISLHISIFFPILEVVMEGHPFVLDEVLLQFIELFLSPLDTCHRYASRLLQWGGHLNRERLKNLFDNSSYPNIQKQYRDFFYKQP